MKTETDYPISSRINIDYKNFSINNKIINFNDEVPVKAEYDKNRLTNLKKINSRNIKNYFNQNFKNTHKNKTISFSDKVNNKQDGFAIPSQCINELKVKADIATTAQNMFNNNINCFALLDNYLNNYSKTKYENLLNMYEFLYCKLKYKNNNKTGKQLYECNGCVNSVNNK